METEQIQTVSGKQYGTRLSSRVLEEHIQEMIARGERRLKIDAFGQHGIGGRLWKAGDETVHITVDGSPGQRVGSMGFPNTFIEVMGPASDDVGWLNAGATIVVHGNAANGVGNAMAQGKIFVGGNIGARGMTMTKQNPRFDPPQLWVLGSVGDYFGEFMAGGIAVVCGVDPQDSENVLGYRPLVGMVGGKVFFRGAHTGFSQPDAKLIPIDSRDIDWLFENLKGFLEHIDRSELFETLSRKEEWQLLVARTPQEKVARPVRSMQSFHAEIWDKELGKGGLIGDLTDLDRSLIPVITQGNLRRFVPVWENRKYAAPCEATCPTGIPVQERWRLIRDGRIDEAIDLALSYTPFPATVCGYLCPHLCMQACTRQSNAMAPVDIARLGKASINAKFPDLPPESGKQIAVLGGGPAGISVAWQLRRRGHRTVVYDKAKAVGGKITSVIPESRLPMEVAAKEVERVRQMIPHVHLQQELKREDIYQLKADFEFIVIATGAQKPRTLPVPGNEKMIAALDFLSQAKTGDVRPGKRVVIIGAGNVGCDAATEAHRFGASEITLIDIQEPASFGKEREDAEAVGAVFRWPVFTEKITDEGVVLKDGEIIPADTVIISIGDAPDLSFLPETVAVKNGFVDVDDRYQTSDPQIFAIGDVVRPGILTDAIGSGRKAALAIIDRLSGEDHQLESREMIDRQRIKLEYFDPRIVEFEDMDDCGSQCSSCGACRDCGTCVSICPETAIRKIDLKNDAFEYVVDGDRCIGCGFCAGACPCGIWNMKENEPIG